MTHSIKHVLVAITFFNLAIVLMFPPFDDYSVTNHGIAIFYGFVFIFAKHSTLQINQALLYLELMVILINLGIFWLITSEGKRRSIIKKFDFRKAAMVIVAINLIAVLMFPPFEYISNMTQAIIPSFEGFYFVFSHPPYRAIVTPILYLEVFLVLINGGLMLLLFKNNISIAPSAEDALAYVAKVQGKKKL